MAKKEKVKQTKTTSETEQVEMFKGRKSKLPAKRPDYFTELRGRTSKALSEMRSIAAKNPGQQAEMFPVEQVRRSAAKPATATKPKAAPKAQTPSMQREMFTGKQSPLPAERPKVFREAEKRNWPRTKQAEMFPKSTYSAGGSRLGGSLTAMAAMGMGSTAGGRELADEGFAGGMMAGGGRGGYRPAIRKRTPYAVLED
jgi:hypothetical protein